MSANDIQSSSTTSVDRKEFTKRVWIAGSIGALIVVVLLLIKATFSVFLLLLASILVLSFFLGLSDLICRKTNWKHWVCLTTSIVGTFLIVIGLFALIGTKVVQQAQQLSKTMPSTVQAAKSQLSKYPMGQQIVQQLSSKKSMDKAKQLAQKFFQSTFGILGDIYVILLLSIFLTVSPTLYKKGMLALVPAKSRDRGEDVLDKLYDSLKKWLKGKLFAMFVVFVLTAIALAIMGMPLWLVLALIAGILNFIPNFGPLIALIPAVLVGFTQGPTTALIVAIVYTVIQVLESSVITPTVQKKLVNIPPALIIGAQMLVAPLTGIWGLILATPLILIVMVLVQQLYVKKEDAKAGA